jgi:hypothetical protein
MQHLIHHLLCLLKMTCPNRVIHQRQRRISVCQRRACKCCYERQNEMQLKTAAHGASEKRARRHGPPQ